jgi:hypothetical protein
MDLPDFLEDLSFLRDSLDFFLGDLLDSLIGDLLDFFWEIFRSWENQST